MAQSRKDKLQQEQRRLLDEIEEIKSSIKEAESKKVQSLSQLKSLNSKIEKRQKLITNINYQLENIEGEIIQNTQSVLEYQTEIKVLKQEYAKIISTTYKKGSATNNLMFIFSSKSFHQAIARLKYIRNYSTYRNNQARRVFDAIDKLKEKIDVLNKTKVEKVDLLDNNKKENLTLVEEKNQQDDLVKNLKSDINKLRAKQREKDRASDQLKRQIEKIIQDEIRKRREKRLKEQREQREKEQRENKDNNVKPKPRDTKQDDIEELESTPAELALQNDFMSNKGKLPWPVAKGHITEHFGRHSHPLDPDLIIDKLGVDIKTNQGSEVRCVFSGKVTSIFTIPGLQQCIMIEHGKFITVYSHISLVYVKAGEMVNTKEPLGKVYFDEKEEEAITEFQIWNGQIKLNPEDWLLPK